MSTVREALAIALVHQQAGRLDLAEMIYRRILATEPEHTEALHQLALVAFARGQLEDALALVEQALQSDPLQAPLHNSRGMMLRAAGRSSAAAVAYQEALRLTPDSAETWYNLGNLRRSQGALDEAVECYRRAIALRPGYSKAELNLGAAFLDQGKTDEAIACYQQVARREPRFAGAFNNLGVAWQVQGRLEPAIECFRRAIELEPDYADAHNNLGGALQDQGRLDDALASYQRALELRPDFDTARSNCLCALRYAPGAGLVELQNAGAEYQRRHAAALAAERKPHPNVRQPERRLRVGFVSPDFARGPVGTFLIGPLEHLDRDQFEVFCYSDRLRPAELTARFQAAADVWRDTIGLNDAELARQIRDDRIDILFDLSGHAPRNRLLVFARKPAPVQITWLDSVGSTGLTAIDYLLADRWLIPPEAEPYYTERVLRMPECAICYDPPDDAPSPGPLPALSRGQVTFASFNNPAKVQPPVVKLWSAVLSRVPQSRLILKHQGFDDPGTQQYFAAQFARHGVDPARVELRGLSPRAEYFRQYQEVDLALDPFPHTGGLTTCDALWMGTPVVTCPGATFASRQGLSYLSTLGLTDTVAGDRAEYVRIATQLAEDLPRLAALREELRSRVARSPLCDARRFAAGLADLLRGVWHAWVAGGS
jgi:predicted O-linked N-acetylglucosamine transferase (SPINDLY family)